MTADSAVIFRDHQAALRGWLVQRVSDPADADDLLQEIMVKVQKHLPDLRESDSLRGWLYQIARNATVDYYRAKGRGRDLRAEDFWYEEDTPDIRQSLEPCIAPLLAGLPPGQADLLRKADLGEAKQKDLAAEMDLPLSTLKSRVQKARQALRHQFETCCSFESDAGGRMSDFTPRDKNCDGC